jgi:endonuclease/exonuclease/phosphatase family metal-dependent hydrolase
MARLLRQALLVGIALVLVAESAFAESSGRIKVMSFNILCSFCNKKDYDPWLDRLAYFGDIFARHTPDLVGIQELTNATEVEQINKLLPNHDVFYYRKGSLAYPDAAIFYRKERFQLVESGVYWLSPTPDITMTTGFTGKKMQLARLVVWVLLRETPSGAKLLFVCTHFDPNSPSQEKSAPLLLQRTAQQAHGLPAIIVGDFNSRPESKACQILTTGVEGGPRLTDAWEVSPGKRVVSNQSPPAEYHPERRIDHIYLGGQAKWTVYDWAVDMSVYGPKKRYPSDHWAIAAEVSF